jgi:D-psicose/D-tagatose/L-ribulose 3-epimerase
MKYGMNLLLWTGEFSDEILPVCEKLKAMGYDGVEVPVFNTELDYTNIGAQLDSMGLARTAVCVRNEDDNPISSDPKIRRQGIDHNKRTLDCCASAGMETLVGPYHSAIGVFSGAGPTEDEWKWGVESMREVAEHAESVGVRLAIEALNRFECYLLNSHSDAARFVSEVDNAACGMMYDTFHANIEEKDVAEAFNAGGDKLFHVHISENDRSTPGRGAVPWDKTFDAIVDNGYNEWLVIEAFGLALPELAAATKIWRRMYRDEMTLASEGLAFMKTEIEKRRLKTI